MKYSVKKGSVDVRVADAWVSVSPEAEVSAEERVNDDMTFANLVEPTRLTICIDIMRQGNVTWRNLPDISELMYWRVVEPADLENKSPLRFTRFHGWVESAKEKQSGPGLRSLEVRVSGKFKETFM